jgi:hypothetical protein
MGFETDALGDYSTAMGYQTTASGIRSTAMGYQTTASGSYSTAMGYESLASGIRSTVMGYNTIAPSYAEVVVGHFNTIYTPNSTFGWSISDRLFVIGNGTDSGSRSNAMTILKRGYVGIGTDTPQELLHINGGRLRIGDEIIEDGGTDILAFSSSLVPTFDGIDRLGGPNRRWLDVYATNGAIQTSDRREKKNIKDLNYGLDEVLQMQPVSFNWKNKNNPDLKLGLIAQELQVLIPEVVNAHTWQIDETSGALTKKELERLGVYYSDLVPVLIKAIQEQQEIISSQKNINLQQKTELQKLNQNFEVLISRIENLESKNSSN